MSAKLGFKQIIILFWTAWWLIALWTDVVGGLSHLQWMHVSWANDANYIFLVQSLQMYHVPRWLPPLLFSGIIVWSFFSFVLFAWASLGVGLDRTPWMRRVDAAFGVSLCFWLAFF